METQVIRVGKQVAIAAAYEAGKVLKERFGSIGAFEEKDSYGDIITEADLAAERIILHVITTAFPDHHIRSEEFGDNEMSSDWMWLVDPLDGTNNFAVGLPLFSVSITLLYKRTPVLSVIYEPMTDRIYTAVQNEGAFCNQKQISCLPAQSLHRARIGWIQGHRVQNEPTAVKLRHYLDINTKRMMRLWAPTLQWCMLARGDLDGIILYNSEGEDLYSGVLMVQEAGGVVVNYEGAAFEGMTEHPYLIACRQDHKDYFIRLVREGLQ